MPLDLPEILSDLQPVIELYNLVEAAAKGLPPKEQRTAAVYVAAFAPVLPKLAALIDTIEAQAKS